MFALFHFWWNRAKQSEGPQNLGSAATPGYGANEKVNAKVLVLVPGGRHGTDDRRRPSRHREPELVAAVSNAGGLGVLGAAGFPSDCLETQIRHIQDLTDRPFGVDILVPSNIAQRPGGREPPQDPRDLLPEEQKEVIGEIRANLELPDGQASRGDVPTPRFTPQDQLDTITGMQVPVFATGLGNPAPFVDQVHTAGGKVVFLVGNDEDTRVNRLYLYSGKTMRNITNELIEAWEDSGTQALSMGLHGLLTADIAEATKQGERQDLLMNAAGQISGHLKEFRPTAEVLEEMVRKAVEVFASRLPSSVKVAVGGVGLRTGLA